MKKFRDKKRYYRNLEKYAANFRLELGGPNHWYDFWHQHFDWEGRSNQIGRERVKHIKAIFTAFEKVLEQLKDYKDPCQAWLSFSARRPTQDALYFHTPNPNQDNFPYQFNGFEWNTEVPALLVPFMKENFEVGIAKFNGEVWYAVRVRDKA